MTEGIAPIPVNLVEYEQRRGAACLWSRTKPKSNWLRPVRTRESPYGLPFDPFNMIMQQLNKLDGRLDRLDSKIDDLRKELSAKIDSRVDSLHQELHNTARWIIGTIIAVAGVATALASWLFR